MSSSYYRPYTSDDDTDDSGSDTSSEDSIARGLDDPRYAIIRAAGPSLDTVDRQLFYQQMENTSLGYAYNTTAWNPPDVPTIHNDTIGKFAPATQSPQSSLFSFSSENRDKQIYPYSTFFTIKTPRTYKNITQIKFVNISFPYFMNAIADASSLYVEIADFVSSNTNLPYDDCYACLGNVGTRGVTTAIEGGSFSEFGRMNPAAPTKELVHTFKLRPGSYNGPGLCAEMDTQMNLTPPFTIMSYGDHRQQFMATKAVDHLFNEGGKWYYSITNKTYIQNPSRDTIRDDHLPHTILADPTQPSERETFVAYFLPILKQSLNTAYDYAFLDLSGTSLEEAQTRVLQRYEGLSSPYYYSLCYANLQFLRSIRPIHTFEYYPINKYDWVYNPATKKSTIIHTGMHPTLVKDIQARNILHQRQEVAAIGYTPGQFGTIQSKAANTSAIVADLHHQVQKALTEVGVPYGTCSAADLVNSNIALPIQETSAPITEEGLFALTEGSIRESVCETMPLKTLLEGPLHPHASALNSASLMGRAGCISSPTFQGVPVSCNDFPSLYSTFVNYYSTNTALVNDVARVQLNTRAATDAYVNKTYGRVFPATILQDSSYLNNMGTGGIKLHANKTIHYASSPLDVDGRDILLERVDDDNACCGFMNAALNNFYGCLPSEYLINSAFYKLGYGISNILSFYSTNSLTDSPTTHNVYLQMNSEQSLNSMDIGVRENRAATNETTGECKSMFGMLLTAGSRPNDFTQTIVQVPAVYTTSPLASLDHFSFTFFLDNMVPIHKLFPFQLTGTDWNAIIQIDENIGVMPPQTT